MASSKRPPREPSPLPTREDVLNYLATHPNKAGKRDIARAFGLKGADKIGLKALLKELQDEGLLERHGKTLLNAGDLPSVTVLTVVGRDSDGELLAAPVEWDEDLHGDPPRVLLQLSSAGARARRGADKPPGLEDRVLARLTKADDPADDVAYTARIIKVLDRVPSRIVGVLRLEGAHAYMVPIDRKQRELDIDPRSVGDAENGDLVAVELVRTTRGRTQRAKIAERIGSMKSENAISMIALHEHNIPHIFPSEVLEEAEAIDAVGLSGREDWRDLPLITIDPKEAKDHDDAVYAEADDHPDNPGGVIVTVAIADVAAYVTPGSAMDREAQKRGNSVYFPDRVVPMLPERISNDLCSLRERETRPAMAVRMIFGVDGQKRSHTFHRVLMRSAAKLAYEEAQQAIDGAPSDKTEPLLASVLRPLFEAYAILNKGREAREPLELDLPEKRIKLNADGTVQSVFVPPRLDAHKLIEEFMIQANVAAAETLEAKKSAVVYRIHDAPSREKLISLKEFLATLDIKGPGVGGIRPSQFNRILASVRDTEHVELVNEVVLRSQAQAEYNPLNIGHFGLNLRRYAHFTSPIRRYADLLVHRSLIRALGLGKDGLPSAIDQQLETICGEISATERRAMLAERGTIDRLVAHFLADQVGSQFHGKVTGVTKAGLFVRLNDTGADGFVPVSTLGNEYFRFDEVGRRMIGETSGRSHRLGDYVDVRIAEAEPLAGSLRFEMLTEGKKLSPRERPPRLSQQTPKGHRGKRINRRGNGRRR